MRGRETGREFRDALSRNALFVSGGGIIRRTCWIGAAPHEFYRETGMGAFINRPVTEKGMRGFLSGAASPEAGSDTRVVLFLYINFAIKDRDVRGYIAMLMDLPSLGVLKGLVNDFIARVVGPDEPSPE
jgi:hypothetical protein